MKLPLEVGKIVTVTGVRRSGKTFLLYQTIRELQDKIPSQKIVYFNFEDERLQLNLQEMELILTAYRELYPDISLNEVYFFFDEIQNVEGWETFIRRLYNQFDSRIYLTGSNSRMLSSEIATALRGRTIQYEVFPFSFAEYLSAFNMEINDQLFYLPDKRAKVFSLFTQYLQWGGFPEIVFTENEEFRIKILQEYFEVMLYRDLIERFGFRQVNAVKFFLKRFVENITSPLSIHKIYNELKSQGYKIAKDLLYDIFEGAENIYLLIPAKKYSESVLKREQAQKKVFLVDTGLVNTLTFSFSQNWGKLLENALARELKARFGNLYYFRGTKECDFIIEYGGRFVPIQVTYSIENEETLNREVKGLVEAVKYLITSHGYLVTMDDEKELQMDGITIHIIPAWKFFLKWEEFFYELS
ncbi:MAG: ATP-binding protein [Marinilabiliales bacterium]